MHFKAVNIEETHTGVFFTLMVKALCWGERITLSNQCR